MSKGRKATRQSGRQEQAVPRDWERINLNERLDVAYWCRALACAQADLEEAVQRVGVVVTDVRAWLAQKR